MNNGLGMRVSSLRIRFSFIAVIFGFFVFAVGAKPGWFGWDRSPVVGFVQIAVFLIGLAMICIGGYVGLIALWGNDSRSIVADIGMRLIGTGYVISVFTGMADVFGMGSHLLPAVPYFRPARRTDKMREPAWPDSRHTRLPVVRSSPGRIR
jgi:hypothetical protein